MFLLIDPRLTPDVVCGLLWTAITTLRLLGFAGGVWGSIVGAVAVSRVSWDFQTQLIAVASGLGAMFVVIMLAFYRSKATRPAAPAIMM
jgi:hypothetical protein